MEQEAVYRTKQDKTLVDLVIKINPMGAVRSNRNSGHKPRVKKYHNWKEKVQWLYRQALLEQGLSAKTLPQGVVEYIEFGIEVGKTTRDRIGEPHTLKPDWDNLCKAFFDSIFYKKDVDDCTIHTVGGVKKVWVAQKEGYIKITFNVK